MLGAVRVTAESLEDLVGRIATTYGVDPNLVKATIKQESGWDVNASRYEAHLNDSSWGLMQVLLSTAKSVLGNNSLTIQDLVRPEINITAGTKYLSSQLARYNGNIRDAIAAYNAGSARRNKDGTYVNQGYVDSVYRYYMMYRTLGPVASVVITQGSAMNIGLIGLLAVGTLLVVSEK